MQNECNLPFDSLKPQYHEAMRLISIHADGDGEVSIAVGLIGGNAWPNGHAVQRSDRETYK
jgi:hypothetical protein